LESALGWIGKIAEFVGSLFPRLLIVEATHRGVRFRHGKHVIPLEPGLHIYWPLVTMIQVVPVVRQTTRPPVQGLTTKDGHSVSVRGMVRYKIRNIKQALAETWELDVAIADESTALLCDLIMRSTFDEIKNSRRELDEAFTEAAKKMLTDYGVTVLLAHLTDFVDSTTLNHQGEAFNHVTEE
jgi:regulator of protease activity HflC (stomatin/prohibitin superfamily)